MKKIIYILSIVLLSVACSDLKEANPYADDLHTLIVETQWPLAETDRLGADVRVEDINTGSRYVALTDAEGRAAFTLPNGLYRVTLTGGDGRNVFNASADKVVLSGSDLSICLDVVVSKAGSIVIKEIYCGGCKKLPEEGDYQADQYIILHNNDSHVQYLDGICFGTLSPYNSAGFNPWISEGKLPDFLPIIQAVWQFPGKGDDFPLLPGEDAIMCIRGAIDHAAA